MGESAWRQDDLAMVRLSDPSTWQAAAYGVPGTGSGLVSVIS